MSKFQDLFDSLNNLIEGFVKKFSRNKSKKSGSETGLVKTVEDPDKPFIDRVKNGESVGVNFSFYTWNFFFRPIVSLAVGMLVTLLFLIVDAFLDAGIIDVWMGLGLVLLFAYIVGMGEAKTEKIPEGRKAMLTIFGIQYRAYLNTGEYRWIGRRFFIGLMKVEKKPMTDKEGYFFTDVVQVNIWNVYEADPKQRSNLLVALTKTGGEIKANLLLMIQMRDPMLWIRKTDPMMDIGERHACPSVQQ